MKAHRRKPPFPKASVNADGSAHRRSQRCWKYPEVNFYMENPYVRVEYSNSRVKVSVNCPYANYTYSDPYAYVRVGVPEDPEIV